MNRIEATLRKSNIELLRILCMLMIVSEHLASYHNKGTIDNQDLVFTDIIRNFCTCSVNSFVLISGYFGIKFKLPRLLDICNKAWFYSVLGLIISIWMGVHAFAPRTDFLDFFPVLSRRYWFITVYVVLYLLSPFINGFVDSLSKDKLFKFLALGGGLFYLWPTLCWATNAPQLIPDAGYGIVNFVYLYILGRYIRLH